MSFFKKLFGGGSGGGEAEAPSSTSREEYKGFIIEARPYKESGQFQLAGMIAKEIGGVRKEYSFVRADRFASKDEAASFALVKGRQIVDEQGDRMFS